MKATHTHAAVPVFKKPSEEKLSKISTDENEVLKLVYRHQYDLKNVLQYIKEKNSSYGC